MLCYSIYLPAEKLIAAPQPNALRPIKTGKTLEAKFCPNDFVKLKTHDGSLYQRTKLYYSTYNAAATINSELFIVSSGKTIK